MCVEKVKELRFIKMIIRPYGMRLERWRPAMTGPGAILYTVESQNLFLVKYKKIDFLELVGH